MKTNVYLCSFASPDLNLSVDRFVDQAVSTNFYQNIKVFRPKDLSKKSLDHQNKLIKKHQIKNLTLFCNDFRLLKFDKKFDYIISTGVIHHLEDPSSALKYFNDNFNTFLIYLQYV